MKKSPYYYQQRARQESILNKTNIFEGASGNGVYWDKENYSWSEEFPHILKHIDSVKNLFAPIRQEVLNYFEEYDIAWWGTTDDRYFPTGNLLSSQIHCLNHLFAIRKDENAVLSVIQKICPEIKKVLPSPIDWHEFEFTSGTPQRVKSFISFEFALDNDNLLGERCCKRGKKCTSIDAFIYAENNYGKRILIGIEWKYTECYDKTEKYKVDTAVVERRYLELATDEKSNLRGWLEEFYWDPLYELARQTLLLEQIIAKKPKCGAFPIKADDYIHTIVRPNENKEIIGDIQHFKDSLKDEGKKRIIEVAPEALISPLKGNDNYKELLNYLETRYWK